MMYILERDSKSGFYASYGSLIHQIMSGYFDGAYGQKDLVPQYLTRFYIETESDVAPGIRSKFFLQGLDCMRRLRPSPLEIVGVETKAEFSLDGYPFVGFIDLLLRKPSGELILVDHKSHDLKPRSHRRKPTKSDQELDDYLVQLYLYAHFVHERFGRFPEKLVFHCYRTGNIIEEVFDPDAYDHALNWAVDLIHQIEQAEKFPPNLTWFQCRHLCGVQNDCEYASLGGFSFVG